MLLKHYGKKEKGKIGVMHAKPLFLLQELLPETRNLLKNSLRFDGTRDMVFTAEPQCDGII